MPGAVDLKRTLIERDHPDISIRRQYELLSLNRSTLYYQPATESAFNLQLMRLNDEQYLRAPFYGWPRMTAHLRRHGYAVNGKRIRRLMQLMGMQAIYPKPKTTLAGQGHKVYPNLLRDLEITRPCQVWSADITYVSELDVGLERYFHFYNHDRPHQSLQYRAPVEVYFM